MIELMVKVTVLLGLAFAIMQLIPRRLPGLRHLVVLGGLTSVLVLPAAIAFVPRWDAAVLPGTTTPKVAPSVFNDVAPQAPAAQPDVPLPRAVSFKTTAGRTINTGIAAASLWLVGSVVVLLWAALGQFRLNMIARRAWPAADAVWQQLMREESLLIGVKPERVRLCISPAAMTPVTWGVRKPVILLPEDALVWDDEHRRVVLRHELAHIARRDAGAQMTALVTCSAYWFHPMVWLATRALRTECERACDAHVVASGIPAVDYAEHLLDVAQSARALGAPGSLSLAMARPSRMEERVRALLDDTQEKRIERMTPTSRASVLLALAASIVGLAAFRPVAREVRIATRAATAAVRHEVRTAVTKVSEATRPVVRGFDSTFTRSIAARPGGHLNIEMKQTGGSLTITGWDETRIELRAHLGGRNWHGTVLSFDEERNGATLRVRYEGEKVHGTSFSHSFDLMVPRKYDVRVSSGGGSIALRDIEGRFEGSTGGGEIDMRQVKGVAHLSTGGGDIHVDESELDGRVETGGGTVKIVNVKGSLEGSSGSGDVLVGTRTEGQHSDQGRGIQRSQSGGGIVLDDAPNGARLSTGGGSVRIGPSGGEVYVSTGGGNIDLGPVSGSVVGTTGAGDMDVAFAESARYADLSTGQGSAVITVAENANVTIYLESAYTDNLDRKTKIVSDWTVERTETDQWDSSAGTPRKYVRAKLVLGNGRGELHVRVVNGDVTLRKGR